MRNNRTKTKDIIKENIFALYESSEVGDVSRYNDIERSIYYKMVCEYKGWNIPLKDFTYKHMGCDFIISYSWHKTYKRVPRRIRVKNNYGDWGMKDSKIYIKQKIIRLINLKVKRQTYSLNKQHNDETIFW